MTDKSIFNGVDVGDPPAVERARCAQLTAEIRATVHHHLRAIVRGDFREFAPIHNTDIVRNLIRIEIDYDHFADLLRHVTETGYSTRPFDLAGPYLLDGVAMYKVAKLPEPGWRVVNPYWIKS